MSLLKHNTESIRLVGGTSTSEGRVEIFHNNVWGSVCDDAWDLQDAQVVCRELGFLGAVEATHQSRFGAGQGPIHLDDVVCRGTESSLIECIHPGIGMHNCGHHEDAGVVCREGKQYFYLKYSLKCFSLHWMQTNFHRCHFCGFVFDVHTSVCT